MAVGSGFAPRDCRLSRALGRRAGNLAGQVIALGDIMRKSRLLLSCAVGALGLFGGVAQAATATPASGSSAQESNAGTTVGELVITAEKRGQTLQTVPVAVSAYTAAKRQLIGIDSIQDMSNFTPGLEYNTSTDRIS